MRRNKENTQIVKKLRRENKYKHNIPRFESRYDMIKSFDPDRFIEITKEELKNIKEIAPPEWARFAKTGSHTKFSPQQEDWWYTRSASILRKIGLKQYIGVSRLRTYFGGKKERGHKPERFRKAGGAHIRKIFQQLEAAGLVKTKKEGLKRGRLLTEKGQQLIKKIVSEAKK